MEKRRPHYDLREIKCSMSCADALNLTISSRHGIKLMSMSLADAFGVIQNLSPQNFYKSMTTHADHRTWQDVYHASWRGKGLYIKFQKYDDYLIVSFKEL